MMGGGFGAWACQLQTGGFELGGQQGNPFKGRAQVREEPRGSRPGQRGEGSGSANIGRGGVHELLPGCFESRCHAQGRIKTYNPTTGFGFIDCQQLDLHSFQCPMPCYFVISLQIATSTPNLQLYFAVRTPR